MKHLRAFWKAMQDFPVRPLTGVGLVLCIWFCLQVSAGQKVVPKNSTSAQGVAHQSKGPTLDACFLNIPDIYLPSIPRAQRRKLLRPAHVVVRDERNGYLQIAGDAGRPTVTIAKFRKSQGTYLIAFTADFEMGSECKLLDEQFVDVTQELIPDYHKCDDFEDPDCYVYELPRYGTTIVVKDGQGRERYRLGWRGNCFERLP